MKKCPYCAEDIQEAAIKCTHCGQWLNKEPILKKVSNAKDIIIEQVKKDFNRAEYDQSIDFATASITGWIFVIGGTCIGVLVSILLMESSDSNSPLLTVLGVSVLAILGAWFGGISHEWVRVKINKVTDGKAVKDVGTTSSHDSKSSNETVNKTTITINQLAEAVVQIPHLPNELNKKSLDCLIEAFEIADEEKKELLKVEYSAFCYSLMYHLYGGYIFENDKSKIKTFQESALVLLSAYCYETYGEQDFENIYDNYSARVESYGDAFDTENYSENISDLFKEYISLSLAEGDLTSTPIIAPVSRPLFPSIESKIACAAVLADIWEFIDWHMEGWELVDESLESS